MIYKILESLPAEAVQNGTVNPETVLPGVPLDIQDGFIHLSTKAQLLETLNKYFSKHERVYLLAIDIPDTPGAPLTEGAVGCKPGCRLQWDFVRSRNEKFAHIYGHLTNGDISEIKELERGPDGWTLW
ncbi:hypothetical protein CJU90_1309 [Yarrowia sp. C11]|nr:hypothetical protein CKK34_0035 [Yarrowia sp. E02]KAG5371295.1 hypothetical protein CJU90_1309 [Yarrowia sp. C11]